MIIKCGECGKSVSNKATTCPHCGFKKPWEERLLEFFFLLLRLLFYWVVGFIPFVLAAVFSFLTIKFLYKDPNDVTGWIVLPVFVFWLFFSFQVMVTLVDRVKRLLAQAHN